MSSNQATFISFISASGGVGKTKLALILAYYLIKRKKKRVLFIDLDPTAGASFSVFDDERLEEYLNNNKSFSSMIKHSTQGRNIEFDDYKVLAEIGDKYIDFIIPGDDLVDIIGEFWKGGSAGPRFQKKVSNLIPTSRYDYIIVDTAPFFDPRYTTLSIYLSDYFVIPTTPNVVDFRRNIMMLRKIRDDIEISLEFKGIEEDVETWMKRHMVTILNKVPTRPNQAEFLFYKSYILGEEIHSIKDPTVKRIQKLIRYAEQLSQLVTILKAGIKSKDSTIGRFPKEAKGEETLSDSEEFLIKVEETISK